MTQIPNSLSHLHLIP